MIYLKSPSEIAKIKQACAIFKELRAYFTIERLVGKQLTAIDQALKQFIEAKKATCVFNGYLGFSGYNCLSLNQTIIHGVADSSVFGEKDKLTLDVGIALDGYICDAAFTVLGQKASPKAKRLLVDVQDCFASVVEPQLFPKNSIKNLSLAIQTYFEKKGYFLLRDFGGHGCGIAVHEDPLILNYYEPKKPTVKLETGMVICVEPMVMTDTDYWEFHANQWNVLTPKSRFNCHIEQMYLITESGFECLTN